MVIYVFILAFNELLASSIAQFKCTFIIWNDFREIANNCNHSKWSQSTRLDGLSVGTQTMWLVSLHNFHWEMSLKKNLRHVWLRGPFGPMFSLGSILVSIFNCFSMFCVILENVIFVDVQQEDAICEHGLKKWKNVSNVRFVGKHPFLDILFELQNYALYYGQTIMTNFQWPWCIYKTFSNWESLWWRDCHQISSIHVIN